MVLSAMDTFGPIIDRCDIIARLLDQSGDHPALGVHDAVVLWRVHGFNPNRASAFAIAVMTIHELLITCFENHVAQRYHHRRISDNIFGDAYGMPQPKRLFLRDIGDFVKELRVVRIDVFI